MHENKQVEIIRLTRNGEAFSAHRLPAEQLVEALEKPTLRAESVLDGIFAEAVVVLESEGDRLLYHTTWDTLIAENRIDVHFSPVGGTGGIAETCKLYRMLNIPVAIVADLDVIATPNLKRILEAMEANREIVVALLKKSDSVTKAICKLPPLIAEAKFTERLRQIAEMPTNWDHEDDFAICKELRDLSNELDRMRRLKSGGIDGFPDVVAVPLRELVASLKQIGIFLVPVGELEGWLAAENVSESKARKAAWANAAALKVQALGAQDGDIWGFLREVGSYFRQKKSQLL